MPTVFVPILGRLGNIFFVYCHARAWCEQNNYELSMHPWIGEQIFNIPEAVRPEKHKPDVVWPERMYQHQNDLIYTRKQVRQWLQFKDSVLEKLSPIKSADVLLDVRQGDDMIAAGLVCLSEWSYILAVGKAGYNFYSAEWERFPKNPTRLPAFTGNVDACGLGVTAVSIPAFYRMMIAKVHFRANSTFSWWAAVLGNAKVYAPVIKGMTGGVPDQICTKFVEGNHPCMAQCAQNSDLHLAEESLPV